MSSQQQLSEIKQAKIESVGSDLDSFKSWLKKGIELKERQAIQRIQEEKTHQDIEVFFQPQQSCQKKNPYPEPFFHIPDDLLIELDE